MTPSRIWNHARRIVTRDLWRPPAPDADGPSRAVRLARIAVLAVRGYNEHSLPLRASALTFYSLLSVVPTAAMAFGIAQGFGLKQALERALRERLVGQEEILTKILSFSDSLLANTKGGLVAGFGVLVLGWTVLRLLNNIERSFNAVWGIARGRSVVRKLTDYLAIVVVAPLLLLISSSAAVFVTGRLPGAAAGLGLPDAVLGFVKSGVGLLPFGMVWLLLSLLYLTLPNTDVSWRAGLAAGVVAGTLYQALQFGYFELQLGVSRYNAVYGSFAALPLFLFWLYVSWLIVLIGAEVSYAVDNARDYARERAVGRTSHTRRRLLAVRLAAACAGSFVRGEGPVAPDRLARELDLSLRLVHEVIGVLVAAGVLAEVRTGDRRRVAYQPTRDPAGMDIFGVALAYDRHVLGTGEASETEDDDAVPAAALGELTTRWRELTARAAGSDANLDLTRLAGLLEA